MTVRLSAMKLPYSFVKELAMGCRLSLLGQPVPARPDQLKSTKLRLETGYESNSHFKF